MATYQKNSLPWENDLLTRGFITYSRAEVEQENFWEALIHFPLEVVSFFLSSLLKF